MMHWWGNLLFNQARVEADYWSDGTVYVQVGTFAHKHAHTLTPSACTCECFLLQITIRIKMGETKSRRSGSVYGVRAFASVTPLEWSAVCRGRSSLAAVIWIESAWYYWRGNGGLETGGGLVGIQKTQRFFGPLCCGMARSWPAYLYAKCHPANQTKQFLRLGIMLSSCLGLFGPTSRMRLSVCFGYFFLFCA